MKSGFFAIASLILVNVQLSELSKVTVVQTIELRAICEADPDRCFLCGHGGGCDGNFQKLCGGAYKTCELMAHRMRACIDKAAEKLESKKQQARARAKARATNRRKTKTRTARHVDTEWKKLRISDLINRRRKREEDKGAGTNNGQAGNQNSGGDRPRKTLFQSNKEESGEEKEGKKSGEKSGAKSGEQKEENSGEEKEEPKEDEKEGEEEEQQEEDEEKEEEEAEAEEEEEDDDDDDRCDPEQFTEQSNDELISNEEVDIFGEKEGDSRMGEGSASEMFG